MSQSTVRASSGPSCSVAQTPPPPLMGRPALTWSVSIYGDRAGSIQHYIEQRKSIPETHLWRQRIGSSLECRNKTAKAHTPAHTGCHSSTSCFSIALLCGEGARGEITHLEGREPVQTRNSELFLQSPGPTPAPNPVVSATESRTALTHIWLSLNLKVKVKVAQWF